MKDKHFTSRTLTGAGALMSISAILLESSSRKCPLYRILCRYGR